MDGLLWAYGCKYEQHHQNIENLCRPGLLDHLVLLIHSADPQSWSVVIILFAHVVRMSVIRRPSTFQYKTNFKWKQCSLLAMARLWVCPSGSLMTPVLFNSSAQNKSRKCGFIYLAIFARKSQTLSRNCLQCKIQTLTIKHYAYWYISLMITMLYIINLI